MHDIEPYITSLIFAVIGFALVRYTHVLRKYDVRWDPVSDQTFFLVWRFIGGLFLLGAVVVIIRSVIS